MPHRETRKIIAVGKTSFAVILPRPWLRFYGLKNGDQVTVISNGSVTIQPPTKQQEVQYEV